MSNKKNDEIKIIQIAGFALVTAITVFAFAWRSHLAEIQSLGQFGDYLGGVMNPIIAFCALAVLLMSVSIQREELRAASNALNDQIKHQEKEARKSDLLAAISAINQNIDGKLIAITPENGQLKDAIRNHLHFLTTDQQTKQKHFESHASLGYHKAILALRRKIIALGETLKDYENISGEASSKVVTDIHKNRIGEVVQQMVLIGFLTRDEARELLCLDDQPFLAGKATRLPTFMAGVVPEKERWW